jgi:hypothetical protein
MEKHTLEVIMDGAFGQELAAKLETLGTVLNATEGDEECWAEVSTTLTADQLQRKLLKVWPMCSISVKEVQ